MRLNIKKREIFYRKELDSYGKVRGDEELDRGRGWGWKVASLYSTYPVDAKAWFNMLEKCFKVVDCLEERKVRRNDASSLGSQTSRDIFKDKYYLSAYCEVKIDEFLILGKGSLSVVEYESKYTALSWYVEVIVASVSDRCRGLRGVYSRRSVPQL
ncbi:hypothetical protein Csa_004599 [Cucumis sativus]|uniref:Uncharacterized protein n=1 Tax=Cucumis sativus TaxID=3659 RepID=A0A0A0L0A4_CUCSA|nr:hypothetical protein Csa_004599 [Cucumis sativus]